ncbi:hypothetical protein PHJA_001085700 [Phtheirospermum japonicum]|uniref:Fringe n=1 Tax=Phtheirospermum japonicum TaxID=374723 RepID=A0A830C546_9LAMI|nr:hypothetical protein PHJA_001085700 [Phtheirospermum japonicum]
MIYCTFIVLPNNNPTSNFSSPLKDTKTHPFPPTNLSHLAFALLGSEKAWHHRKPYIESWWRPGSTRGLLLLDTQPAGDLLPWSPASPPYRVSRNLTDFVQRTKARAPVMIRMVHGIMEAFAELDDDENLRWLVMGDDDSVFLVDNIVDVLAGYDHTKYYYIGGQSEFIMSNYWFSFNQGFGGAGFMLSYPLAKALAKDMENCLTRHAGLSSADTITMACVADVGVNLSPHKGIHQIDLHGDISGFLSSHPKSPLISLHHFDMVDPIFPTMDRFESTRHLMKAAAADQSRMLQQTICYHRPSNWSFSISWGYSAHIYEKIEARSYLQNPIETFQTWSSTPRPRPHYMFNTRLPSNGSCEAPHVFFFQRVKKGAAGILTTYSRAAARGLPPCWSGGHTADSVSEIRVLSPVTKRKEMDRCECCDIVRVAGAKAELKFRECLIDEIIA